MKILKFSADWCQPCKILARNIEESDLSIQVENVDIDEQPEVAANYRIRSIPTLVLVDETGELISRTMGVKTGQQIQEWINENV